MLIFSRGWSCDRDGPGQRMIFYLKGCNLRCLYCGNPEGIHPGVELLRYPERRSEVPPEECCKDGSLNCAECTTFECVNIWHHPEFELAGEEIALSEILRLAEESRSLFGSDGGVTFGGGEPTFQYRELFEAIDMLQYNGFNVTVESNASLPAYTRLIGKVDHLISDCKAVDGERHRRLTGSDNAEIKKHLRAAAAGQKSFLVRVPLIPGFNADEAELERYCEFFNELNELHLRGFNEPLSVQCLRLHHMGASKYRALGREYKLEDTTEPSPETASRFAEAWKTNGLKVIES